MSLELDPQAAVHKVRQLWRLYGEIDRLRERWQELQAKTAEAHKELAAKRSELEEATRPPEPMPLYDRQQELAEAAPAEPLPWPQQPVTALGITFRVARALEAAGIQTLGDLAAYQDREGRLADSLVEIDGIGGFLAASIAQAFQRISGTGPTPVTTPVTTPAPVAGSNGDGAGTGNGAVTPAGKSKKGGKAHAGHA